MIYGITVGDSSGVGPEILLKAFRRGELRRPFVAYGDLDALQYYRDRLGYDIPLRTIASPAERREGELNIINAKLLRREDITPGKLSAKSGYAARGVCGCRDSVAATLAGEITAMVTLPMNKEATQLSDPDFVGHTELIGALCGVKDVTIMLASDQLIVTHVSTHVSLARAIELAKKRAHRHDS